MVRHCIGKELVLWAAEAGYVAFAGCPKKDSFEQFDIKEGSRIIPIVLDATCDQDVAQAAAKVSEWINSECQRVASDAYCMAL